MIRTHRIYISYTECAKKISALNSFYSQKQQFRNNNSFQIVNSKKANTTFSDQTLKLAVQLTSTTDEQPLEHLIAIYQWFDHCLTNKTKVKPLNLDHYISDTLFKKLGANPYLIATLITISKYYHLLGLGKDAANILSLADSVADKFPTNEQSAYRIQINSTRLQLGPYVRNIFILHQNLQTIDAKKITQIEKVINKVLLISNCTQKIMPR